MVHVAHVSRKKRHEHHETMENIIKNKDDEENTGDTGADQNEDATKPWITRKI